MLQTSVEEVPLNETQNNCALENNTATMDFMLLSFSFLHLNKS